MLIVKAIRKVESRPSTPKDNVRRCLARGKATVSIVPELMLPYSVKEIIVMNVVMSNRGQDCSQKALRKLYMLFRLERKLPHCAIREAESNVTGIEKCIVLT